MRQLIRVLFLIALALSISSQPLTAEATAEDNEEENRVDLLAKVLDKYYLDFQPIGYLELPRIIYDDGGFYVFRSTTSALNSDAGFTDADYVDQQPQTENGTILPASYDLVRTVDGEPPAFDMSITANLVFFWLSALLTLAIFIPMARWYRQGVGRQTEPRGAFQNMFETMVKFIRDEVAYNNIGPEKYHKFTPYLLTVFFMILWMNLFGLLPWGVSSTADITITAALALLTFVITQAFATREHWKHVFWFPGVPVPIRFILMPVEFVGLFTKPFALCIRLFANMTSGKILIFALLGIIFVFNDMFGAGVAYGTSPLWIALTLFIYLIKAFVAFLQAYVFTILSALFIGMAVADHDEEHSEELAHSH